MPSKNATTTRKHFDIKPLDPKMFNGEELYLVIGPRGSGKTKVVKSLCYHLREKVDLAAAYTPTCETAHELSEFIPESCIYDEIDIEQIQELCTTCEKLTKIGKKPRIILILDDCLFDSKFMKTKIFSEIHMNGRHLAIPLIATAQHLVSCPPQCREQYDYVIVRDAPNAKTKKRLYDEFFSNCFDSEKEFNSVLAHCTKNYGCLVYVRKGGPNPIDKVRWYKAKTDLPEFRLGKKKLLLDLADKYRYKNNDKKSIEKMMLAEAGLIPKEQLPASKLDSNENGITVTKVQLEKPKRTKAAVKPTPSLFIDNL